MYHRNIFTIAILALSTTPEVDSSNFCIFHPDIVSDWDIMKDALIYVESNGNNLAVGSKDDVGVFQITPVYVKEVNRILGDDVFELNDRYCPNKSHSMFEVYNGRHNKNRDILKAIKIHNPKASSKYRIKVMKKMIEYYGSENI